MPASAHGLIQPQSAPTRLGALIAGLLVASAAPAAVVFSDTAPGPDKFASMPQFTLAGTTATTNGNAAGNPDPGVQTVTGALSGQSDYFYATGYLYSAFTFDPSRSGAASRIDFAVDRRFVRTIDGVDLPSTVQGRPLIEQGGVVYMAVSAPFVQGGGFTHVLMQGLSEMDFGRFDYADGSFDPAVHPDFDGAPMRFGFGVQAIARSVATTSTVVLDNFSDNFFLRISTVNDVAEPGPMPLLAIGWLAWAGVKRRRMRIDPGVRG